MNTPTDIPEQAQEAFKPDLLLTFSSAFMDGYIEGDCHEVKNHWERIRAALSAAPVPKGAAQAQDTKGE